MDINDTEGDSEAGVYTLPVVLGAFEWKKIVKPKEC